MDKTYDHKQKEKEIYNLWQSNGLFSPEGSAKVRPSNGKPYTILMPPPNANAALHCGHATYAIQDIMTRFKRMQGFDALYLPGTDHAGFETQVVYERKLKKEGKSRFDFDRETLYNDILKFVLENSDTAINQLKQLGMSADWDRNTFMLDKKVIDTVYRTFIKMHKDGFIYRSGYMVNYSTLHGTTFSDLETEYKETVSPLYFVKYKIEGKENEFITVATVRPETIYADVAIAVNPNDDRYKKYKDAKAINPLNDRKMPIIFDEYVDKEFGTGALKITPGHDINDYKIGVKNKLEIISLIELDGKMNEHALDCKGLYPKEARRKVREILTEKQALEKVDENYTNNVLVDYKDGFPIEPMILQNWFLDTSKLFDAVIDSIEKEEVKFYRPLWKQEMLRWISEKKPWPISRQTVFGIRIPAWYDINKNPNMIVTFLDQKGAYQSGKISEILGSFKLDEVKNGLQKILAPENAEFVISIESPGLEFLPETDTFDTWFSSGQWPLTTTDFPDGDLFKKHFPTDFMDSMWDIMFFWIARMIMFSKYLTGQVPFKQVYFHGAITDSKGVKMSKSKGNVINPIDVATEFGADALRFGVIVGGDTSARLSPLSMDKVRGYRNFANKIWNIARFIKSKEEASGSDGQIKASDFEVIENWVKTKDLTGVIEEDRLILEKLTALVDSVTENIEGFKFKLAGEEIYHFIWDDLASGYLEQTKNRGDKSANVMLKYCLVNAVKLLHPFMPFITETIWQELCKSETEPYLITSKWPK